MPDRVRKVLGFVVANYVVRDEQREIDLTAGAREPGAVIAADKRQAAMREAMRADEMADDFRDGLLAAFRARLGGEAEVALDDRRPDEDRMADALIHFLVRYGLAASRTEETDPMRYVYRVAVDWPRLNEVGARSGVDLETALRELVAQPGRR